MGRRATFLTMAVVLASAALPGAASALRQDERPAYLKAGSAEFSLNERWHGAHRVTGIGQYGVQPAPADPGQTVWGPSCGAAKQTVVFTRKVELLGPARSGSFRWWTGTDGTTRGWTGLRTLEFLVNGHPVFHWSQPAPVNSYTFPATVLKQIRVGSNNLELRATRDALPAGSTKCNTRGQKPAVALTALFDFGFGTDLRVGVPAENPAIRHTTSIVIKQFVKNLGPDRALDGELRVFYGGQGTVTTLVVGGRPCEQEYRTTYHCRFKELDPGKTFDVLVKVEYEPPTDEPNWDHYNSVVQFSAGTATGDTNPANDHSDTNFIMCQQGSTLAQCK